jgi:predicted nucleic acid-binding protein
VRVFVDTSALVALWIRDDQHRRDALRIARGSQRHEFFGTTAVLTEFHSYVLYRGGPGSGRSALQPLLIGVQHTWLPVSVELIQMATVNWLDRFPDQRLSLVDAISFETMQREKITHAFAFDHHFEMAGFQLLR